MLKYGFENIRKLSTVEPIEIRPITLLVGRNSSGKSTFLRTLPLFRQSINTKTSSPILWYGDLVDFGSYEISVANRDTSKPIVFSFEIDRLTISPHQNLGLAFQLYERMAPVEDINLKIYVIPVEHRTRISQIKLSIGIPAITLDLYFNENGILEKFFINGFAGNVDLEAFEFSVTPGALFPDIVSIYRKEEPSKISSMYLFPDVDARLQGEAFRLIRRYLDNRIADKTLRAFVAQVFSKPILTREHLRSISIGLSSRFRTFVRDLAGTDTYNIYKVLEDLVVASSLSMIVSSVSRHLRNIFRSTLYIGPARARSERYYRYQDLAVSEIDPDGKNFPMFLNSLAYSQIRNLSEWIRDLFGYGIEVLQETGHISIQLIDHNRQVNVTDVGYGVSQILPVLGQIWWARERPARDISSSMTLLAIEQPELHLHPAHQALLADALVGETLVSGGSSINKRVNFIIETHSETLINRLGELISRKKISQNEVQILLFEPSEIDDDITEVREITFDDKGVLMGWPFGFFEPEFK